jgi:very-short-patch-repair endonuclease
VEYDGAQHWTDRRQRSWDIDRPAMLEAAGWLVIRVTADLLTRPDVLRARIRAALSGRGAARLCG